MKRLIAIIFGCLGLWIQVSAQVAGPFAFTNSFAAGSTNTLNLEIETTRCSAISLQLTHALVGVGNSNVVATFQQTVDGTNWHALATMSSTSTGTATASYLTNLNIGAIPKIRLSTIVNPNSNAISSLLLWVSRKNYL